MSGLVDFSKYNNFPIMCLSSNSNWLWSDKSSVNVTVVFAYIALIFGLFCLSLIFSPSELEVAVSILVFHLVSFQFLFLSNQIILHGLQS
jgi:hypothetical protein